MKKNILIYITALMMSTLTAQADLEKTVPVSEQKSLTMTIYNGGRALVNDVRHVNFDKGRNLLSFVDISDMVIPSSVLFNSKNVKVREQNFNFDLLTMDNLMRKSVGQKVNVEYINPANGNVTTNQALLLAYDYNRPILKIDDKIETAYPGRIIFNRIPDNLSARPTLIFDVDAAYVLNQNAEISYLTNGISWNADYVVELDKDGVMDLNGLVTLTNNTSVSYKNVQLQLVAGEVNMVQPVQYNRRSVAVSAKAMAFDESANEVEQVSGYYLYTIKRPTDILSNQTKQVALLSANAVGSNKTYIYDSALDYYSESDFKNKKPVIYMSFQNTPANGLGEALPRGTMRVYEKDSKGGLIFVGEDTINHTAKGQDVRLRLGEDFDITAMGKRVSFKKLDSKTSQAEFEVKISNAKTRQVSVRFNQFLPNGWSILAESLKSQKEASNKVYWDISIPAEGSVILTFKVQVDDR